MTVGWRLCRRWLQHNGMPRRFFRRISTGIVDKGDNQPWYLHPFRALLSHPQFFSVDRRSVAGAVWIGLLIGLLPVPGQTLIVILLALMLRVNLPVAALFIWVTNPLSIGPIFYTEYRLGALLLDVPVRPFAIELSWQWLTGQLLQVWKPLLLGSMITATVIASLAYLAVSVSWRVVVGYRYRRRHLRRQRQM